MLSGELLFKGDYEQAVIYSILNDELDLSKLKQTDIQANLIDIITRCLDRKLDKRFKSMDNVIEFLTDSKPARVTAPKSNYQIFIYSALAFIIIALLLWNQFSTDSDSTANQKETKFTKITFDAGLEDEPTFSPDGKFLAYTTDDRQNFDIIVKPLDGGKTIRIVDHQADDAQPSWSPDGNTIAFVSSRDHSDHLSIIIDQAPLTQYIYAKNGDIFTVPALGGQEIKIVENGYYPQWSPDSKQLVYQSNTSGSWNIWITHVKGGAPKQLTNDNDFDYHPAWSDDGRWILFASRHREGTNFRLNIIDSNGGKTKTIYETEDWILNPRFSKKNDNIIYSTTSNGVFNIVKISLDLDEIKIQEKYNSVTQSENHDVNLSLDPNDQRIAYSSVTNNPDIYEIDTESGNITPVISDNAYNDLAQLSPDGKKLLYQSNRSGNVSAWIKNIINDELYRVNTDEGIYRWTADGKSIIYRNEKGIVLKRPGDANEKIIIDNDIADTYSLGFAMTSWDLKYIACGSDSGIILFAMDDGKLNQLTFNQTDNHPTWSPDNKYIVFQRGQGTGRNLHIIDMNRNETQLTSGPDEDSHPFWSPVDPDKILFLRDHKNLYLLSVSTGELKQLTNYNRANTTLDYPSFSFDGKKVYYSLFNKIGDIFILEKF